jgi:hypothetical protein
VGTEDWLRFEQEKHERLLSGSGHYHDLEEA